MTLSVQPAIAIFDTARGEACAVAPVGVPDPTFFAPVTKVQREAGGVRGVAVNDAGQMVDAAGTVGGVPVGAEVNPVTGGVTFIVGGVKAIAYVTPNVAGEGADDAANIQAALDYVGSFSCGGKVILPLGVFKVTNTLHVPSNVVLEGAGISKTVLRSSGLSFPGYTSPNGNTSYAVVAMQGVSHCAVRHLTADLATNNTSANGITVEPSGLSGTTYRNFSSFCTIENCEVLGANYHEYLIWNMGGSDVKILNNVVDGRRTVPGNTVDQEGIEVYGGINVEVRGNTVKNIEAIAIAIGSNVGWAGDNFVTKRVFVSHNHIENCNNGILIQGNSDTARSATWITKTVDVHDNTITGYKGFGIHLYSAVAGSAGGGDKLSDINIHDNTIDSNGVSGTTALNVQLPASEDFYRAIKIHDNTFINNISAARTLWFQYPSCLRFYGNEVVNSNNNLAIVVGAKDVSFDGNRFDTYTGQFEIQGSTRTRIKGNRFANGTTNTTQTIKISSASFFTDIVDNDFDTLNNYPHVLDVAGCDYTRVSGNRLNYANTTNQPFQLNGTNKNFGRTSAIANAGTTADVAYTNAIGSPATNTQNAVVVTQVAGPTTAFEVTHTTAGFTITCATPSDGTTVFAWERF